MTTRDCNICYSPFRKTRIVACPMCEYECCVECISRYFSELTESVCPSCTKPWTREFVSTQHKDVLTEFKKIRERRFLQIELARLPETQAILRREEELLRRNKYHIQVYNEYKQLKKLIATYKKQKPVDEKILKEMIDLKTTMNIRLNELSREYRNLDNANATLEAEPKAEKILFNCPADECRGFITEKDYACGICDTKVCKKCNLIVKDSDGHECNPDDVETAKILRRETKPCPECHATIYKTEGCDQMWCTQCKTPFSWRSGQKVFERIHNPHYYEWQRQQNGGVAPRVEGDDGVHPQCNEGGFVDFYIITRNLPYDKNGDFIRTFHRAVGHILYIFPTPSRPNNLDVRARYLKNEITREKLGELVQRREKRFEKDTELRQLAETIRHLSDDIFQEIARNRDCSDELTGMLADRACNICNFFNVQTKCIAEKYKNNFIQITSVIVRSEEKLQFSYDMKKLVVLSRM